jgi:hypothetical protein
MEDRLEVPVRHGGVRHRELRGADVAAPEPRVQHPEGFEDALLPQLVEVYAARGLSHEPRQRGGRFEYV